MGGVRCSVASSVSAPFEVCVLAHHSQRESIMLLVQKYSNELWAIPPILPHKHVEPSCQLKGSPALSTQQRSEEHTSELQSHLNLVCRLLLEKKKHCPTL